MRHSTGGMAPGSKARGAIDVPAPMTTLARQGAAHAALPLAIGKRVGILGRERVSAPTAPTFLECGLLTPFLARVAEVVVHSPKEKVVGPNTGGVVAPVAYDQAVGNGAIGQLERIPVGANRLVVRERKLPIPALGDKPGPRPAPRRHRNVLPEAFRRVGARIVSWHGSMIAQIAIGGKLQEVGAA